MRLRFEQQTVGGGETRRLDDVGQRAGVFGNAEAHRHVEDFLAQFDHAGHDRRAAGEHDAGREHFLETGTAQLGLDQFEQLDPSMLDALESLPLVCLDSLEAIAGNGLWERALFDFYNRWKEKGEGTLVVTGCSAPRKLGLQLPDLASRLDWGVSFHLDELDDEGKLSALQLRAELRGFKLPIDVGRFLLNRLSRDMRTLLTTLNQLDNASFRAKRKLTIPFVKEILEL